MPSATAAVGAVRAFLDHLLDHAESVKTTAAIEPPLEESDFDDVQGRLSEVLASIGHQADASGDGKKSQQYFAIIETAVRDRFSHLVHTIPIDSPAFVKVWNLFDILSILSDSEQCDPALLFWLAEELLESQTIAGCREVFSFLESRRERITARHFGSKKLVILRTCNELLRRLSRALDPAFCGRVFIFMFQCFPLGDKSSVNLRGEYHVENVTVFDQEPAQAAGTDKMEVDSEPSGQRSTPRPSEQHSAEKPLDPDALYPIFWSLQEYFSQPKKLFEPAHFAAFKAGLHKTMAVFLSIKSKNDKEKDSRSRDKQDKQEKQESNAEDGKKSLKRKRDDPDDELASGFNPKYLTSRDLFKLEISDLAFRRNVLVQVLIILEFLLSLSPQAKEKLASVQTPNKAVIYSDQQLSEEDTKWAEDTKAKIAKYIKESSREGPYYYRMVETVLSRDKNWVRWKIEGCQPIELDPIKPEAFVKARDTVSKMAAVKRIRPAPMSSMSLDFLDKSGEVDPLEKLRDPARWELPDLQEYKKAIADDDFEIEMPTNAATKAAAIERKASKTWRALRIARKTKLALFDKIESDDKIDVIFDEPPVEETEEKADETNGDAPVLELLDRTPIVVVDANSGSKSSLAKQLVSNYPGTFRRVPPHVTRQPKEGEAKGKDYHFVDRQAFNVMRDGDQFIEFSEEDALHGECGTKRSVVDAIIETGKVPVMEMDLDVSLFISCIFLLR